LIPIQAFSKSLETFYFQGESSELKSIPIRPHPRNSGLVRHFNARLESTPQPGLRLHAVFPTWLFPTTTLRLITPLSNIIIGVFIPSSLPLNWKNIESMDKYQVKMRTNSPVERR
jgi:hypothetical protein